MEDHLPSKAFEYTWIWFKNAFCTIINKYFLGGTYNDKGIN